MRTRAAITTAAALVAAAAFAGSAHAAVTASAALDPNTTLPATMTDGVTTLALCADGSANCSSVPSSQPVSLSTFDPTGEAFYMLVNADFQGPLAGSVAEFALEASFLNGIKANEGAVFSRIRYRLPLAAGHYRITHPWGVDEFDVTGTGSRSLNDTTDTGCFPAGTVCDYAATKYGEIGSIVSWDAGAPNGYLGDATTPHKIQGGLNGVNTITVERLVTPADEGNPDAIPPVPPTPAVWEVVDQTDKFTVEGKLDPGTPITPVATVGASTNAVAFPTRRLDAVSSPRKVTVRNTGAADLHISGTTLSGPDAGDFTATSDCATVAPGAACTVTIGFVASTPPVGERAATLTIASDAANAPQLTVALSGVVSPAPAPSSQSSGGSSTPTIIQIIQASPAGTTHAVATTAPQALAVSRLALAQRISVTRLRLQGLRASMRLQEGTPVVRIAISRATGGRKSGRPLFATYRVPHAHGVYRVTLKDRGLLRRLRPGQYVIEVQAGHRRGALGRTSTMAFRVTR